MKYAVLICSDLWIVEQKKTEEKNRRKDKQKKNSNDGKHTLDDTTLDWEQRLKLSTCQKLCIVWLLPSF
jgi:hypothetical protein